MAIGVNWAEIWKPVWAAVWTFEPPIPPEPEPPPVVGTGAAGRGTRYIAYINGKRHLGSYFEIRRLIEEVALREAKKDVKNATRQEKRVRIVIEAGKPAAKTNDRPAQKDASGIPLQREMRDHYLHAYTLAKIQLENDEDDALALLL